MYVMGLGVCSWGACVCVVIGMDSGCVLYLVRVTGWVDWFFLGGCAPQNFKENFVLCAYLCIKIMSCCCFTYNFVKSVCSRKANFYFIIFIDNKDSVLCILYSDSVNMC